MTGFYWIASYPKSGNTWLRLAMDALLHPHQTSDRYTEKGTGFAPNASQRIDIEEALDVESSDLTPAELQAWRPLAYRTLAARAKQPLYRKVHDAWTRLSDGTPLFPLDVTLGSLVLVRDPRDVAVSWAHFAGVGLEEAVAALCHSDALVRPRPDRPATNVPQRISCWSGHVRSWLEAPGRPCCLIRYEDLLDDPATALQRAAKYAEISHDEADIARAVRATRFEVLREQEQRHGFDGGQLPGVPFFRTGRAGQWRTELTRSQVARIIDSHREVMERLGYGEGTA